MIAAAESTRALLREALASAYRPDPEISVSEWAEQHRVMTSATTATVGKWRNDRNSLLVEVMDCLSPYSPVRRVSVMGPSQFGKTEVGLNLLGHTIDQAPAPFLIVRPDLGAAKKFSRQRIDTMIAASPNLRGKVSERKSRDKANTTLIKEFLGGILILAGAKSAASLRDMPAARLWMDELDAYDEEVGDEGDPAALATNRTLSFGSRAKILETSTPTIKGRSRIERAFELGDRSRRLLPCPHCAHFQSLRWEHLKWTKTADLLVHDVYYECESCKQPIGEHQKAGMLAAGMWVAERPEQSRVHRSFHWNALYHPPGSVSWADLAQMWVDFHYPRLNIGKLKDFVMTKLAEPYEQKGEAPEWQKLYRRREQFRIGTVPRRGLLLTAGVDVQKDRLQGSVYAWGRDLERWLVDRFTIAGDAATDAPWKTLEKMRTSNLYRHESSGHLSIRCLAVDTGYLPQVVYNWCRTKPRSAVLAVKGSASMPFLVGTPKQVDIDLRGRKFARGVLLWTLGVGRIKEELYGYLGLEAPLKADEPFPRGYCHFPEDLDDEFFQQLCAEELKPKKHKGYVAFEWEKIRERNEALDEAVYARAAAAVVGIDRWSPEVWDELERQLGVNPEPPPPPASTSPEDSPHSAPKAWKPRRWRPGRRTT